MEHPECRTRFSAQEMQLDQLGYIVENRLIQLGLWQEFEQYDNLDVLCSEELDTMTFGEEDNHLHLVSGKTIQASWVVGADGANSKVRSLSGIAPPLGIIVNTVC